MPSLRGVSLALTLVALAAACGGATASESSEAPRRPAPGEVQVSFGPLDVAPFSENTQCVVKRLGNAERIHVGRIENVLGAASHHMIVYRVNDTEERTTPFDCVPFLDTLDPSKGAPLMVTQKHQDVLALPPGVAFTLEPNQMVRLEVHYLNPSKDPVQMSATSIMTPVSEDDFRDDADFLFVGNVDVSLPPRTATKLGPTFFPLSREFIDSKFFAITGHEHQMGTNVQVEVVAGADAPGQSVYDVPGWSWSEPATVVLDPPVVVPEYGGFRFTCSWNNTGDTKVRFGESAQDEMCFFWAYYYPSHGAKVCFHTGRNGGMNLCCPGDLACPVINDLLRKGLDAK